MTIQEMVDAIDSQEHCTFEFFYNLEELTDQNNVEEAVSLIQQQFDCSEEIASQVYIEYKKQIYADIKKSQNENPLSPEQIAHANAVAREWQNKPKCPTCQSQNLKKISATSKVVNTAVWGIFGTKRHKTFHCNNCGYEW